MLRVNILGTGVFIPPKRITTAEVCAIAYPGRDPAEVVAKTGIETRYQVDKDELVSRVGAAALRDALDDAGLEATDLKRVILMNSHGFDDITPATANALIDEMGIANTADCFDLNNGCTSFLTGFDLAARCVATGFGPVALVASELFSRHVSADDPRPFVVFGDAAAAVILGDTPGAESGVISSHFANDGRLRSSVTMSHSDGVPPRARFRSSNKKITAEALSGLQRSTDAALKEAGLGIDDIRWFLLHQGNGVMFARAAEQMGLPAEKLHNVVRDIGSVGCASVPVSLHQLWRRGDIEPGDYVVLSAVGAGLSYGAVVYRA